MWLYVFFLFIFICSYIVAVYHIKCVLDIHDILVRERGRLLNRVKTLETMTGASDILSINPSQRLGTAVRHHQYLNGCVTDICLKLGPHITNSPGRVLSVHYVTSWQGLMNQLNMVPGSILTGIVIIQMQSLLISLSYSKSPLHDPSSSLFPNHITALPCGCNKVTIVVTSSRNICHFRKYEMWLKNA